MLIIGLVGEIASGKSTFSDFVWENFGIPTISMRDAYETPGLAHQSDRRASRYERSRILDEKVENVDHGKSKTIAARNLVGQVIESKLKGLDEVRTTEIVVVADITRMIECQVLRNLCGKENFLLFAIEHLDSEERWQRYTKSFGTALLDKESFAKCDQHESGKANIKDNKDWASDIFTVASSADRSLRNAGTVQEFEQNIAELLKDLGIKLVEQSTSRSAYVLNQSHIPNSTQRVRELQQRHLVSRFLSAFYALEYPTIPPMSGLAGISEPADEFEVVRKMGSALASLGITPGTEPSERHRSLSALLGPRHAVREISNQFMHRLVKVFLLPSTKDALEAFKQIPFSTPQEEVLVWCLNETEFVNCHRALHDFLNEAWSEIHNYAVTTFAQSRFNCDRIQKTGSGTRGLDQMLQDGLHLSLMPGSVEEIKRAQAAAGEGPIPVLELMKNRRVIQLAGLDNSKVSHAIHDAVDHVWFFDLLRRTGVIQRHEGLFNRLGAPQDWDLFQRAGECVASISFGVRLFANQTAGFVPLHSVSEIEKDFSEAVLNAGRLEDRHVPAFSKIRVLSSLPLSLEAQSLEFVWSNYLVELNEQRRKDGEILEHISGANWLPLDPRSLDYMAFFIDAHTELHNPKNKHRDNLFRVHLSLEEYFSSEKILEGAGASLKWSELTDQDAPFLSASTIPPKRIEWMARHYGFTALRDSAI